MAELFKTSAIWVADFRYEGRARAGSSPSARTMACNRRSPLQLGHGLRQSRRAQRYWGSSFRSGDTLSTAAFATAAASCVARIRPQAGSLSMALAVLWTSLVGVSRLVLGVHWPSDVLAAMCLGAFIPLLFSVANDLRRRESDVRYQ